MSSRREAIQMGLTAFGAMLLSNSAKAANSCQLTPEQTEGPFYPVKDQADKDTDLTRVQGSSGKALGQVIDVEGVVTDQHCQPVAGVLV